METVPTKTLEEIIQNFWKETDLTEKNFSQLRQMLRWNSASSRLFKQAEHEIKRRVIKEKNYQVLWSYFKNIPNSLQHLQDVIEERMCHLIEQHSGFDKKTNPIETNKSFRKWVTNVRAEELPRKLRSMVEPFLKKRY